MLAASHKFEILYDDSSEKYYLAMDKIKITCSNSSKLISHESKLFIQNIIDEIHSFGDIEIDKKGNISPFLFSSYALLSDYEYENIFDLYENRLEEVLFSDPTFLRVAGPEQIDQIAAADMISEFLENIDSEALNIIEAISNVAYHEVYAFQSPEEAAKIENFVHDLDDYCKSPESYSGDIDPHIDRSDLKNTSFFKKLHNIFVRLSDFEKLAVHGLYCMNGCRNFYAALAYVLGKISSNRYAIIILSSQNLTHGVYGDIDRDEFQSRFQAHVNECTVIDNFLRYGDANRAMTRFVIDSISHGENKNREFKETFQKDVNLSKKSKDISLSVVKTIAAFANTDGGDLFVGVSDDMKIKGIENDFYTNDDKYLLTFYQVVESALGAAAIGMIDAQIKFIQGVKILWVKVIAAQDPVYCNYHTSRGDFFVRQGPLTKNLNPQEADQYRQVRVHKN